MPIRIIFTFRRESVFGALTEHMFCYFELNGLVCLLLHDHGSFGNGTAMDNISDPEFD